MASSSLLRAIRVSNSFWRLISDRFVYVGALGGFFIARGSEGRVGTLQGSSEGCKESLTSCSALPSHRSASGVEPTVSDVVESDISTAEKGTTSGSGAVAISGDEGTISISRSTGDTGGEIALHDAE